MVKNAVAGDDLSTEVMMQSMWYKKGNFKTESNPETPLEFEFDDEFKDDFMPSKTHSSFQSDSDTHSKRGKKVVFDGDVDDEEEKQESEPEFWEDLKKQKEIKDGDLSKDVYENIK